MSARHDAPLARARAEQHLAADPHRSVTLEAAAGAGKTKVLVDRYLRLCLTDPGADPRAILAITFTRKATVEILERLQDRARGLAAAAEPARRADLADLLGREPTATEIARAAWLHEALLDDPAGLGITTLHGFCQRVLSRFAAEAGLDPQFEIIDERRAAEDLDAALDALEEELAADPLAAAAYAELGAGAAGPRQAVAGVVGQRMRLQRWVDRVVPPQGPVATSVTRPLAPLADHLVADLRAALVRGTPWERPAPRNGGPAPHDVAALDPARLAAPLARALEHLAGPGLDAVRDADAPADGPTPKAQTWLVERRAAASAAATRLAGDPTVVPRVLPELRAQLVTGTGDLRKAPGRRKTAAGRQEAFAAAAAPALALAAQAELIPLLRRNATLLRAALRTLDLLAARRRRDRVVDFEDLEILALRLLTDPELGRHLHHRLDARLDHVLLDEFQDTNRNQWDLLQPLLEELLASDDRGRSVFVVGDIKQSIYGFRGAEPRVFAAARLLLATRRGTEANRTLPTNFRSLPAIVQTVGDLCQQPPLRDHLGQEAAGARQRAARGAAGGSPDAEGTVVFVEPFVTAGERSGHDQAAAAVVALVEHLRRTGVRTSAWDPARGRDVARDLRLDDILILARGKTHLPAYEDALRRAGIPYVPAGRGLLARSREVRDILALLRWLTLPADDTAGATALRSPLFRVPEDQVQALLGARRQGRRRSLREVLQASEEPALRAVAERVGRWAHLAGLISVHDLLRRIDRDAEALARMETAGGEQARFNLLRLLDLALAAEARGGSVRDFVEELEQAARLGGEEEGTLPGEADTGRVRVMTVHGAKGLQAPVVILADAAAPLRDRTPELCLAPEATADGPWVFAVGREHHTGPATGVGEERLPAPLAGARERTLADQLAEEAHILYVALTRARDRLYVLGGRNDHGGPGAGNVLDWLAAADAAADRDRRWRTPAGFLAEIGAAVDGKAPDGEAPAASAGEDPAAAIAARAARAVRRGRPWTPPPMTPRIRQVPPSQLAADGAAPASPDPRGALAGEPAGADAAAPARRDNPATRRGTRIHAWLEAACRRGEVPSAPQPGREPGADGARRAEWQEAHDLFHHPELAWVFHPAAHGGRGLSEVPVIHRRPDPEGKEVRVAGIIDRLVIGPDRVDIIDYKSNRLADQDRAALAAHYAPQLGAYRDALARLYPGRRLRCWLLWTDPVARDAPLQEVHP